MSNAVSWEFPAGIEEAAAKAAATVKGQYPDTYLEKGDLRQEALLWAATHGDTIQRDLADDAKGVRYIEWRMRGALTEHATEGRNMGVLQTTSLEAMVEGGVQF